MPPKIFHVFAVQILKWYIRGQALSLAGASVHQSTRANTAQTASAAARLVRFLFSFAAYSFWGET